MFRYLLQRKIQTFSYMDLLIEQFGCLGGSTTNALVIYGILKETAVITWQRQKCIP